MMRNITKGLLQHEIPASARGAGGQGLLLHPRRHEAEAPPGPSTVGESGWLIEKGSRLLETEVIFGKRSARTGSTVPMPKPNVDRGSRTHGTKAARCSGAGSVRGQRAKWPSNASEAAIRRRKPHRLTRSYGFAEDKGHRGVPGVGLYRAGADKHQLVMARRGARLGMPRSY